MKKSILLFLLLPLSIGAAMEQSQKNDTTKAKPVVKVAPVPYHADPNRVYQIGLTEDDLINLLRNAGYGIIPYLKTTKIPASSLDQATAFYQSINDKVANQYQEQWKADRAKFVADSTKAAAVKPGKK